MATTELVFKAMSDVTRQRLLRVLSLHDLSVGELVEVLGQPQSTISRHLKILREAGLLVDRRVGAAVMYVVPPTAGDGAGGGRNGNGPAGLRERMLDWIGQIRLESEVSRKLQRVVRRRQGRGGEFFDAVAARWDQLRIEAFGEVFQFEALTALLPSDWVVADVGSGTGYLLPLLSSRFRRVIAVDPSARMLEVARSRPEVRAAANVEFREGSLAELPLAEAEVDLAVVSLVLHHVEDPGQSLTALRRCLRPGGVMMMIEQEAHDLQAFHERMGDRWCGFAPDRLTRWLEQAGFADIRIFPLATARPSGRGRVEAPSLFVLTAKR